MEHKENKLENLLNKSFAKTSPQYGARAAIKEEFSQLLTFLTSKLPALPNWLMKVIDEIEIESRNPKDF